MDHLRLSPAEIHEEVKRRNGDCLFVFQLRNPIHNGHALLMNYTRDTLINRGYKNPILLVHPVGGWLKEDDVDLLHRVR